MIALAALSTSKNVKKGKNYKKKAVSRYLSAADQS